MSRKADYQGNCFEVAGALVLDSPQDTLLLAHGICTGRGRIAGLVFGHAWVECGDFVIDRSNGNDITAEREMYYAIGACRSVRLYTKDQTRKMLLRYRHWGPWPEDGEINETNHLTRIKPLGKLRKEKRP